MMILSVFLDNDVKIRCVVNWDTDGDEELSKAEAAKVISLGGVFTECDDIVAFDELKYFTGLTEIEPEAFYGAYNLNKITLPKSIKSIGEYAFADCVGLIQLNINDGVKKIGYGAFEECRNLKSITIPGSVEEIQVKYEDYYDDVEFYVHYANPFEDCYSLEAIYSPHASDGRSLIMDNTLIYVASAGINEYTIPAEVKSVANDALGFYDYDSDGVRFPKVVIPESVEYIDAYGLLAAEYHFESMTPPYMHEKALGYWDDYDDNSKPIIYIPDGAYKAYYGSDWSKEYKDAIYHEKTKLATPVLTETHTETSFTVAWEAVSGADTYIVNFKGENYTTTECSYTFENLNAGDYSVRVKAQGVGHEDSEFSGKVVITLTGPTSVDWFSQELFLAERDGYTKYNSVWFTWKGNGVVDLQYYLFTAEDVAGAKDADIKANLYSLSSDIIDKINTAEGATFCFSNLNGSTTYVLYVLVANSDGLEFFTKGEITTEELVVSDNTLDWLGTYTAQTSKVISMNGDNYITSQVTNFTFTITLDDGTADYVWVDGISMMGEGIPAYGQITVDDNGNNVLYLWNQAYVGSDGYDNYAVWYAFADTMDDYYFINGEFPAYILTMNNNGSISFELFESTLSNGEPFKVVAFDVVAADSSYNIQGLYNDVWKYGEWTNITKTEATPRTQSRNAFNHTLKPCDASVVYAM